MNPRNALAQRSFQIALAISLLLHALLLFYNYIVLPHQKNDVPLEPRPREAEAPRMSAMLVPPRNRGEPVPPARPQAPEPPQPKPPTPKRPPPKVLAMPAAPNAPPNWTRNERQEIEKFLEEEARRQKPPAPPPTGQQLAQQALLLARRITRQPEDDSELPSKTNASGKAVEPLSLEMYIAAFIQKLNRGANFVAKTQRVRGQHMGQVQIILNSDGSLSNYRILQAGDQQAEIAYIKSVIDVSAPFSAFPPDLKESMNTLTIPICISPRFASTGGKVFSRSGSKDCSA
jgi:hypothetical protein